MNEGKLLLYKILDNKIQQLSNMNSVSYTYDDINLIDLSSSLKKDYSNINIATNKLIKEILKGTKYEKLSDSVIKIKDLYIGKRDYNISVSLSNEYKLSLDSFIYALDNKLEENHKDITKKDELLYLCNDVLSKMNNNELIEDVSFIKELVNEYDINSNNKNLVSIMLFITRHNLSLLNTSVNIPKGTITDLRISNKQLDDRLIEIIDKLNIKLDKIPNYLLSELKKCNVENAVSVYELIRKNKVEKYGILHLINKDNYFSKLCLLMYSDVETIKSVVSEFNENTNKVVINTLKEVINLAMPVFISKRNEYFPARYKNFKIIMNILKELNVNYKELINKCPLFLLIDSKKLVDMLYTFEQNGFSKKVLINRCYKTMSINPELLTTNLNILLRNGIDIDSFAKNDTSRYALLKCTNLQKKLNYFIKNDLLLSNPLDYEKASKLIITRIYKFANVEKNLWGE